MFQSWIEILLLTREPCLWLIRRPPEAGKMCFRRMSLVLNITSYSELLWWEKTLYYLLSCIAEVTPCLVFAFHLTEAHIIQEVKKQNVSFLHNRIVFTEKLPREEVRSKVAIVCASTSMQVKQTNSWSFGQTTGY